MTARIVHWLRRRAACLALALMFAPAALAYEPDDGTPVATQEEEKRIVDQIKALYSHALQVADDERERTFRKVNELYQKAKGAGEAVPGDAREWLKLEIRKIHSWEYNVVTATLGDDAALAATMNAQGSNRWECVGAYHNEGRITMVYKRPTRSYLRAIPLKDLIRLVPTDYLTSTPDG